MQVYLAFVDDQLIGFDDADVDDVVDQLQQCIAVGLNDAIDACAFMLIKFVGLQQSMKPIMAFNGVRIS